MNMISLNQGAGLSHDKLVSYGKMLHHYRENDKTNENPSWCGAHFDYGFFTRLIPAYYFVDGIEVDEPKEAGLCIVPDDGDQFEKINASDKEIK